MSLVTPLLLLRLRTKMTAFLFLPRYVFWMTGRGPARSENIRCVLAADVRCAASIATRDEQKRLSH